MGRRSLQPPTSRNLLPRDGEALYVARFLSDDEAAALFDVLLQSLAWQQPQLRIFGRIVAAPRLEAWYGDPGASYRYSGLAHDPIPWTVELQNLRKRVQAAADTEFNSVLANLYRTGTDSNGWHADDEPELGTNPIIASISLGTARPFLLRHRASGERIEVALEPGSLLIMQGATQQCWQHSIPKQPTVQTSRINLTFRRVFTHG